MAPLLLLAPRAIFALKQDNGGAENNGPPPSAGLNNVFADQAEEAGGKKQNKRKKKGKKRGGKKRRKRRYKNNNATGVGGGGGNKARNGCKKRGDCHLFNATVGGGGNDKGGRGCKKRGDCHLFNTTEEVIGGNDTASPAPSPSSAPFSLRPTPKPTLIERESVGDGNCGLVCEHGSLNAVECVCMCQHKWTGTLCDECDASVLCSSHGVCDDTSQECACDEFFAYKDDCSVYCNPNITCSSNGICSENGRCICDLGKAGESCQCDAVDCGTEDACSAKGRCSRGACACYYGYHGCGCEVYCTPATCSSHGQCVDGGTRCECNEGYLGNTCSEMTAEKQKQVESGENAAVLLIMVILVVVLCGGGGSTYYVLVKKKDGC